MTHQEKIDTLLALLDTAKRCSTEHGPDFGNGLNLRQRLEFLAIGIMDSIVVESLSYNQLRQALDICESYQLHLNTES